MKSTFEKTIDGVLYSFENTDYLRNESVYHVSCELNGKPFEFRMKGDGTGVWKVQAQVGAGDLPNIEMQLSDAIADNEAEND